MNGTVLSHHIKKQLININTKITAKNLVFPLSLRNSYTSPLFFLSFSLKKPYNINLHDTFVNIYI